MDLLEDSQSSASDVFLYFVLIVSAGSGVLTAAISNFFVRNCRSGLGKDCTDAEANNGYCPNAHRSNCDEN
jgi:hypothetical protein